MVHQLYLQHPAHEEPAAQRAFYVLLAAASVKDQQLNKPVLRCLILAQFSVETKGRKINYKKLINEVLKKGLK